MKTDLRTSLNSKQVYGEIFIPENLIGFLKLETSCFKFFYS